MKCMGGWNRIPAIRLTSNPVEALLQPRRKDTSPDPGNGIISSVQQRPGYDPRFPNRTDDTPGQTVQELSRPLPDLDRPAQNRYDEPQQQGANNDWFFEQLLRADLYRIGY